MHIIATAMKALRSGGHMTLYNSAESPRLPNNSAGRWAWMSSVESTRAGYVGLATAIAIVAVTTRATTAAMIEGQRSRLAILVVKQS